MPLIAGGHGESELPDLLHERRENLVGSFGKQLSNSSRELAERIFGEQMAAEIPRCHLLWDKAADQAFDEELCLPLGAVWPSDGSNSTTDGIDDRMMSRVES